MPKRIIEDFKNNEDYKRIVKRIFIAVLIIVPYIVIFFFLEHFGIVKQNPSSSYELTIQQLTEENAQLKAQIQQLTEGKAPLLETDSNETH